MFNIALFFVLGGLAAAVVGSKVGKLPRFKAE